MNRVQMAACIDHTILKPEATWQQVELICDEALQFGTASVCVNPSRIEQVAKRLTGSSVKTCSVVTFPFGAQDASTGAAEIVRVLQLGANEIDMVLPLGLFADGKDDLVRSILSAMREVTPTGVALKVILETALWDEAGIIRACLLCDSIGADFVKTSTGFHPSGGASLDAVRTMAKTVPHLGIKASGGIRTLADAEAMLDAGATRLGCSATAAILSELAA